jgi:hypothetical protein
MSKKEKLSNESATALWIEIYKQKKTLNGPFDTIEEDVEKMYLLLTRQLLLALEEEEASK